jgi:orotidine-5'-phosphate decarboxylase
VVDDKPLIVALDYPSATPALAVADLLDPSLARVKVGKQLFTREGPALVHALHDRGFDVFLDLKFHDIPNTVAGAVTAAAELGVWMVNVHASGGSRMMRAAVDALKAFETPPLLTAVTVLTSMDERDLAELGWPGDPLDRVVSLAALAQESGVDGVVCSAREAGVIRDRAGEDFLRVTPGIRLPGDDAGDQRRVLTPWDALAAGATHLVMGRSITGASSPGETLSHIVSEIRHHRTS